MKLVAILMDGHKATITLPDNQVHTIDNLAENLDALKTILETADFEGGYVTGCDEYLVPTNFGIMPVAQWISETYNVPFVFSDAQNFEAKAKDYPDIQIEYLKSELVPSTAKLAKGYDAICAFVSSDVGTETIDVLSACGVKLILMRCAGFNNVDV